MTLLNEADAIYIGDTPADRVYLGSNLVWEPSVGGGIAAPVYRSHTLSTYASRPTGLTLDKPAGTVANDIMLAVIVHAKSTPALNDIVAPSGWAKIGASTVVAAAGTSAKLELWWKRAGASEPATYFFDVWGSSSNQYGIVSYSGCVTSGSPIDAFSTNSASTGATATGTSITTTQANDLLVWIGHNWDATGTLVPPTGMTERLEYLLYAADQVVAAAGTTGNRTQTLASSNPWATYMTALKGAGAPTGPSGPTDHLVTAYTPGAGRDDFTGEVGARINILSDITVSWIGVMYSGGVAAPRKVNIYEWFADALVRSVTIDLTGKTIGEWGWAPIAPITLLASGGYYAVLAETVAGSGATWANTGAVTMKPVIGNIYSTYRSPGGGMVATGPGESYVGVDLGW